MRWPQFLLTLINLSFALYLILATVILNQEAVPPFTFLWALIYVTLALAMSHLYMLYMTNKLDDWYDVESMNSITNLSIISTLFCTIALAAHIGLEYYNKKQFLATDEAALRQVVPLIAALICSVALFSSSIKFKKYVILCRSTEMSTTSVHHQNLQRNYRTSGN